MRYFYLGANLRWLLSSTEWPKDKHYEKMVKMYSEAVLQAKTARGVRVSDFVPFGQPEKKTPQDMYSEAKEVALHDTVYSALCRLISLSSATFSQATSLHSAPVLNTYVNHIPSITRESMTFATRGSGLRNSFVLFADPTRTQGHSALRAGQIVDIFLHGRHEHGQQTVEPFFVIDEYQDLEGDHLELDPFRRFPDIETKLYYNRFEGHQRVVRLQDVRCHFAALVYKPMGIDAECIVARSLDRVCKLNSLSEPCSYFTHRNDLTVAPSTMTPSYEMSHYAHALSPFRPSNTPCQVRELFESLSSTYYAPKRSRLLCFSFTCFYKGGDKTAPERSGHTPRRAHTRTSRFASTARPASGERTFALTLVAARTYHGSIKRLTLPGSAIDHRHPACRTARSSLDGRQRRPARRDHMEWASECAVSQECERTN